MFQMSNDLETALENVLKTVGFIANWSKYLAIQNTHIVWCYDVELATWLAWWGRTPVECIVKAEV